MENSTVILGVMSGSSADGLDFALCRYAKQNNSYTYEIIKTGFFEYNTIFKKKLNDAQALSAYNFLKFNKQYGRFIGEQINVFLKDTFKPQFIASHGHTIFHQPDEQVSCQIGDGAFIAAETGISVISDFRNLDTALNGQGAPLVPIGDKLLFSEFDFCLNLGGFANISFEENDKQIAFDICPVNFVLNRLVKNFNVDFDKDGEIGRKGKIKDELLNALNAIPYYHINSPKSLGREYVEQFFYPLLEQFDISLEDKIRTFYKHISVQIATLINKYKKSKILITGGGAHNKFLIENIESETNHKIIIPVNEIIDFKEAIIFGFLGYLRIINEINTLKSVTGASKNSIGGSIFVI
jgi:anhydro-N-acetylmuramic acid kinase